MGGRGNWNVSESGGQPSCKNGEQGLANCLKKPVESIAFKQGTGDERKQVVGPVQFRQAMGKEGKGWEGNFANRGKGTIPIFLV